MKKLIWLVTVFGLVLCCGANLHAGNFPNPGAAPVIVTNPPSQPIPVTGTITSSPCCYRFVGISSGTTPVGLTGGFTGMDNLCEASFPNRSARMCTSQEFINSPLRAAGFVFGWIQPVWVTSYTDPTTKTPVLVDYSGYTVPIERSGNCNWWVNPSPGLWGLTVDSQGYFINGLCQEQNHVVCCAP